MNKLSERPIKVLITGGTSGLGYELVKYFIQSGYEVFGTGRDSSRLTELGDRIHFIKMDLADLADVKKNMLELLERVERFDIVINNAGVLGPHKYILTKDGFEYTTQVNFLSHLFINEMIVSKKLNNEPLTIVSVTSPVYRFYRPGFNMPVEKGFHSFRTYSESKIYLLFFCGYLIKNWPDRNLNIFSFDPGIFSSGISRTKKKWFKIMYKVGALFMRKPGKVAGRLVEILSQQVTGEGKIYRNINKFRELDELTKKSGESFLAECSLKLEKHFK
jgi:retinol dehydrogenase 12